jgi:SAM-dependent methyltransferase
MNHSIFDKRNYPIVDVQHGYGEWSQTYEQDVLDEMDLRLLNKLQSIDWTIQNLILDLACGTGRIGVWLHEQILAPIDGVDITPEMLVKAHDKGVYRHLHQASVTETSLPTATYDLCVQSLADEHLADLRSLYQEVARVTKPNGYFVIVGFHPQFMMGGMPTHYDSVSGESLTIQTYVHLFSDHVKAAHEAGWSLLEMDEGLIDDDWLQKKPKWKTHYGQPISF